VIISLSHVITNNRGGEGEVRHRGRLLPDTGSRRAQGLGFGCTEGELVYHGPIVVTYAMYRRRGMQPKRLEYEEEG